MKKIIYLFFLISIVYLGSCSKSNVAPELDPPSILGLWNLDSQEEHRISGFYPYASNETEIYDSSTIIFSDTTIESSSELITVLITDSILYTTYEGTADDTLSWYQIENTLYISLQEEDEAELIIEYLDSTTLITSETERMLEDMNDTVFFEIETERIYWKRLE